MKSIKVVAGAEPEYTNEFLLALAQCAANPSIDNNAAVQRCLNGEAPGSGPVPVRQVSAARNIGLITMTALIYIVFHLHRLNLKVTLEVGQTSKMMKERRSKMSLKIEDLTSTDP